VLVAVSERAGIRTATATRGVAAVRRAATVRTAVPSMSARALSVRVATAREVAVAASAVDAPRSGRT
jgi:hypothetical protein